MNNYAAKEMRSSEFPNPTAEEFFRSFCAHQCKHGNVLKTCPFMKGQTEHWFGYWDHLYLTSTIFLEVLTLSKASVGLSCGNQPACRQLLRLHAVSWIFCIVAALTCGDVVRDIRPCMDYLKSGSGPPPPPCCAGAKTLASSATSTADKQTACGCLKTASKSLNVNPATAKALPGSCGISLGFAIDPNMDCSTIS